MTDQRGPQPPPPPRPGTPIGLSFYGTRIAGFGAVFTVVMLGFLVAVLAKDLRRDRISIALGITVSITVAGLVLRQRELSLWRRGECVPGVVRRAWTSTSSNQGSSHTVEYVYEANGQAWAAQHPTSFKWDEGKPIWVVFDPRKPSRSLPIR